MFLTREIVIKLCQNYTKTDICQIFFIKVVALNRSYSKVTQPIWKRLYPTGAWESPNEWSPESKIYVLGRSPKELRVVGVEQALFRIARQR